MQRGILTSAALHLCALAGLVYSSLQSEAPWVWPPPVSPSYRTCFYPVVDAQSLLTGATMAEVSAFIGTGASKLPQVGRSTLCLRFNDARSLLLVLDDGRVTGASWVGTQGCGRRQIRVPRPAPGAGYVGPCPGESVPIIL